MKTQSGGPKALQAIEHGHVQKISNLLRDRLIFVDTIVDHVDNSKGEKEIIKKPIQWKAIEETVFSTTEKIFKKRLDIVELFANLYNLEQRGPSLEDMLKWTVELFDTAKNAEFGIEVISLLVEKGAKEYQHLKDSKVRDIREIGKRVERVKRVESWQILGA